MRLRPNAPIPSLLMPKCMTPSSPSAVCTAEATDKTPSGWTTHQQDTSRLTCTLVTAHQHRRHLTNMPLLVQPHNQALTNTPYTQSEACAHTPSPHPRHHYKATSTCELHTNQPIGCRRVAGALPDMVGRRPRPPTSPPSASGPCSSACAAAAGCCCSPSPPSPASSSSSDLSPCCC